MKRIVAGAAGLLAAIAIAPITLAAGAGADTPGPVYFSAGSWNCSISDDGAVGCDLPNSTPMQLTIAGVTLPFLIPTREVVIDGSWLPVRPGFDSGTPHTRTGGNPDIGTVATGHDTWGPRIDHAGASCATGFHGSFSCTSKGHGFAYYEIITTK